MILATRHGVERADFLLVERQTGLTRGNLSLYMSRLARAGYIEIKKEFADKITRTLLRVTDSGREARSTDTSRLRQLLDSIVLSDL